MGSTGKSIARIITAGTVSKLTGGKFANGAAGAAFAAALGEIGSAGASSVESNEEVENFDNVADWTDAERKILNGFVGETTKSMQTLQKSLNEDGSAASENALKIFTEDTLESTRATFNLSVDTLSDLTSAGFVKQTRGGGYASLQRNGKIALSKTMMNSITRGATRFDQAALFHEVVHINVGLIHGAYLGSYSKGINEFLGFPSSKNPYGWNYFLERNHVQ